MGILKRVLEEVEKVMHEFKGTLYKYMEDPNIDLTVVSLPFDTTLCIFFFSPDFFFPLGLFTFLFAVKYIMQSHQKT